MNGTPAIFRQLEAHRVIPVVRTGSVVLAHEAVSALIEAGFRTFEITLTIPGANELVWELARRHELLIGAGTVLSTDEAKRCLEAGARYLVSPVLLEHLPELCREAGVPCILSGLTPSEVLTAWQQGADAVKVFPAASVGGPAHLRALKSVFPDIPLVPTGGVTLDNLQAYLRAGAAFVGAGSDLVSDELLCTRPRDELVQHARKYLDLAEQA